MFSIATKFAVIKEYVRRYLEARSNYIKDLNDPSKSNLKECRVTNPTPSLQKTFYIIRPTDPQKGYAHLGLGNIECTVLMHCLYAKEKGYIPIVDMKNYASMYQEAEDFGKINTWETYYEQPCGYSLDDLSVAAQVIYSNMFRSFVDMLELKYVLFKRYKTKAFNTYIKPTETQKQSIESEWATLRGGANRILGVVCRGTDVIALNWSPLPPVARVISDTERLLRDKHFDKIFLATEDMTILQKFIEAFGDTVVYNEANRYYPREGLLLCDYPSDRKNDKYLRGKEYLTTLCMLSKCDGIAGTAGTASSLAQARNYRLKTYFTSVE